MKNKLLVSVFALVMVFAFTSCEKKSNVTAVCTDIVHETLHKSARSLLEVDGQKLTISEYEFLGGVNDDRLVYRTIAFGNGAYEAKKVDTLKYQYGEWLAGNTIYTLNITPATGEPYTLKFQGNSLIEPDGRAIGGEGTDNTARVEKWEKTIATFPNSNWEAMFRDKFVADSIFEDSIRTRFIPGKGQVTDTIQVFKGKMDTLNADTTCYFLFDLKRDANTLANTGHFYKRSVRSTYNRATESIDTLSVDITEFDHVWYFSEVSSDARFKIAMYGVNSNQVEILNISKYAVDSVGVAAQFNIGDLVFKRPANP